MFDTNELVTIDPLELLEAAIDRVAGEVPAYDVVRINKLSRQLEYQVIRSAGEMNRSGRWQAEGNLSGAGWLKNHCNMNGGTAAGTLDLANKLEDLPHTAKGFSQGLISRAHAEVMARAFTPSRCHAVLECEGVLVDAGKHVPPTRLREIVTCLTDAIDGDDGAGRDEDARERRRFHFSQTLDGYWVGDLFLDVEAGRRVRAALDAAMEADRTKDDPRTPPQRRADAFVGLCESGGALLGAGESNRVLPQISVVIDLADIETRAARGPGGSKELAAELAESIRTGARLGNGLSRSTLERLACDAKIARVITDGASGVLDSGTTTRTISAPMRRALIARDQGCVEPGCDRPLEWCEAHHKIPFGDNGPTSIENLELRCRRHHELAHHRIAKARQVDRRQTEQRERIARAKAQDELRNAA